MKTSVVSAIFVVALLGYIIYPKFFNSSYEEDVYIDIDKVLLSPNTLKNHETLSKVLLVFNALPEGEKKDRLRQAICEVAPRLSMCEQHFISQIDSKMLSLDDPIETILPSTRAKNAIPAINNVRKIKKLNKITTIEDFINFFKEPDWERQINLSRGVGDKTKKELKNLYEELKDIENI